MPQKVLQFTGINRHTNKFNGAGECEELINLRPVPGGGHRVTKYKHPVEQDIQYDQFFEHSWGEYYNQIVVMDGHVIWKNTDTGNAKTITDEFSGLAVSLSFAGNVLMVYCKEVTKQLVFKFEDGGYKESTVIIDPIKAIKVNYGMTSRLQYLHSVTVEDNTEGAYNDAMIRAASGYYGEFPYGLCGAAIIGCTYELDDGSEIWSTAFVLANTTRGGIGAPVIDQDKKKLSVPGYSKVSLSVTFEEITSSNVRKVNIYSTRPVYPYELHMNSLQEISSEEISLEDAGLQGMQMYYQGSVKPAEGTVTIGLKFGTELSAGDLMDVDAGCIERVGQAISYNNRFHFYKSEVDHIVQFPTLSNEYVENESDATYWIAYAKLNDRWILINKIYRFKEDEVQDIIYPMSGVKKLIFVKADKSTSGQIVSGITVPYEECFEVNLKDSTAYNYSYAFGVTPTIVIVADGWYDQIAEEGQIWNHAQANGFTEKVHWKSETNAINVSAPYNPFVFPVEYSYGFGGEIIDIVTSYLPVSAVQYGQYPITVFTTNGIYALEQGNGSVLYGNIVPLQPYILDGPALATPAGTFFVSSKNLYLLAGREALCVSIALNGKRELNLRNLDSYNALCFDLAQMITKEDFEDYLASVTLFYDTFQNELWVCSRNMITPYSYVFNLDTKMFYKSHNKYTSQQIASRYAIEFNCLYGNSSLVDVYDENDGANMPILLQSRPLPLEVFYTHIQRMMMFADAELTGDNKLCVSVFGSDNLQDWKCIISAQKKDVILKQIRTNKAAKSYRDYIILISGSVASGTDLSDLIVDYTVVQRRLG